MKPVKAANKATSPLTPPANGAMQGEGDYDAARRHRTSAESFVKSGKVAQAARAAEPKSADEAAALRDAEKLGEAHSKGEDPALRHSPPRRP